MLAPEIEAIIARTTQAASAKQEEMLTKMAETAAARTAAQLEGKMQTIADNAVRAAIEPLQLTIEKNREDIEAMKRQRFTEASSGASTATAVGRHVPEAIEIGGYILNWDDPDASAMTEEYAKKLVDQILQDLSPEPKALVDVERTNAVLASRLFHYKVVLFLGTPNVKKATALRDAVARKVTGQNLKFNNKDLFVAVQGDPEDRDLRKAAALMWSVVEAARADKKLYKVEYVRSGPRRGTGFFQRGGAGTRAARLAKFTAATETWEFEESLWQLAFPNITIERARQLLSR